MIAVSSSDNKLTLWDFSVIEEDQEKNPNDLDTNGMEIPPQLMFLHQGQNNMKELRFHPQYRTLLFTTAEDSFNIFRPNLDPEDDEPLDPKEEVKESTDTSLKNEESKGGRHSLKKATYHQDSDSDFEEEERRIKRAAKMLNRQR